MVRPDNSGQNFINFLDMRLVDVLTQNPIQSGVLFIRSSKSMALAIFPPHVAVHRNDIISFDEFG